MRSESCPAWVDVSVWYINTLYVRTAQKPKPGSQAGAMTGAMENRLSLVTLGVADTGRARAFYEALGWSGMSPDGDVVFFQAGGMILALWGRDKLAEDSRVEDPGGWGGVTLAYNVGSPVRGRLGPG